MMFRMIALALVCVSLCQIARAQNPYGIKLNPGERLISVNGKPVNGNYVAPQGTVPAKAATTAAKPATSAASTTTAKTTAPATPASASTTTPAKPASAADATAKHTVQKPVVQNPVVLSMYSGTDQQRAQAEANYMAQNGITGHVGSLIGAFEGCGWSSGGMPNTCTPGSNMSLTADAIAHGPRGVYRVRAWR